MARLTMASISVFNEGLHAEVLRVDEEALEMGAGKAFGNPTYEEVCVVDGGVGVFEQRDSDKVYRDTLADGWSFGTP